MSTTTTHALLDVSRLDREDTLVREAPFHFMVAKGQLADGDREALRRDFPKFKSAGYLPYDPDECGPSINALIDEMTGPEFSDAVGERLGVERLSQYPTLVSISRSLHKRHGTIHTDGKSKVVTALMYFNESWPENESAGCLRFLKSIDDIESLAAPEVVPHYGTLAAFKRADNSFHGHLPYEGERPVIQVAWLVSMEEKLRKTQRGKLSRMVKKLLGKADKRIGAGRGDSAKHG